MLNDFMKKIFVVFSLIFSLSLYAQDRKTEALPDRELDLEDCIEQALEANFSVVIARNNLKIAQNNVNLEPLLPEVSAGLRQTASTTYQGIYSSSGVKESGNSNTSGVSAQAAFSWRLFDGLRMFAQREQQRELLSRGEYSLRMEIEQLVSKIANQYFLIVSLSSQVKLLEELVEISQVRYNHALTRYRIGKDSGLEYKQAKIYLNSDSSRLLLQNENVKNAYIELYRLMNMPLNSNATVKDTIVPEPWMEMGSLLERAMDNNTALLMAKSGVKLSDIDLKISKGAQYPTLDLTAGYSYSLSKSQLYPTRYNDANGVNMGLSISLPIFGGGELSRKIRNSRIESENARLELEQYALQLESNVRQQYNLYENNLRLISFEQESKEAAYLNLDAALERYRLGSLSGIEFRDFQLSYLDASDRMLRAMYQTKIYEISLHLLSGDLFRSYSEQ